MTTGYDTTGQTLSYAGYQLTKNPEIMKQLQEEVDAAYEDADGKIPDYTVIQVGFVLTFCVFDTSWRFWVVKDFASTLGSKIESTLHIFNIIKKIQVFGSI